MFGYFVLCAVVILLDYIWQKMNPTGSDAESEKYAKDRRDRNYGQGPIHPI
jgi:hypothetical protein